MDYEEAFTLHTHTQVLFFPLQHNGMYLPLLPALLCFCISHKVFILKGETLTCNTL